MNSYRHLFKVVFLCLFGFLVAELVGTLTLTICFALSGHSSNLGLVQTIKKIIGSAAIGFPAAIYLTYGKVFLMILCGEVVRRLGLPYFFIAGAGVGYWQYLSWAKPSAPTTPMSETDVAFALTLSGLLAGSAYWFVAVRFRNRINSPARDQVITSGSGGPNA